MKLKIYGEGGQMFQSGKQYVDLDDCALVVKDAARYRWLREQKDDQQPVVTIARYIGIGVHQYVDDPIWGEELDAAVDRAMCVAVDRTNHGT